MQLPQIELELDGQRRPLPGQITRLTVTEDWRWVQNHRGVWGPMSFYRDARIVLTGVRDALYHVSTAVDVGTVAVHLRRPGGPPTRLIINEARPGFTQEIGGGAIVAYTLELECVARGQDLAQEDAALASYGG